MSRASSLSAMAQQLSQSLGVGLAALLLLGLKTAAHVPHLTAAVISPAFFVVGALPLLGLIQFLPLPRDAGAELNGRGAD